jgi:hypothetical protein
MTKLEITHSLESLFARIKSWPLEWQEEVIDDLEAIINDFESAIELTPEEVADIEAAEAAEARGDYATHEQIAQVFRLKR